jgi:hypothetical protein
MGFAKSNPLSIEDMKECNEKLGLIGYLWIETLKMKLNNTEINLKKI